MKRSLSSGRSISLITVLTALVQMSTSMHLPSLATLVDLLETNGVVTGATVSTGRSFVFKLPGWIRSTGAQ